MNLLFVSCHPFLTSTRKTSVHFMSEALAQRGHQVSTISVGFSGLTYLRDRDLYRALVAEQKNRFVERSASYRSACYLPALHPFSARSPVLNLMTSGFFRLYARALPRQFKDELQSADAVFLEGGTSICFFDAIGHCSPDARRIYFRRDHLESVGASRFLVDEERRVADRFDHVYVPARYLEKDLPQTAKVSFLPQGIDKRTFDACTTSPYPSGSRNAVVVGNMLFDARVVASLAESAPNVQFHLFGSGMSGPYPSNVKGYGERAFEETVPYIKFADFGIAPYRMSPRELYLGQSSLKLLQYSYCLLPIVAPGSLAGSRDNLVLYRQGTEDDWAGVVQRALEAPRSASWQEGILSWDELASALEAHLMGSMAPCGKKSGRAGDWQSPLTPMTGPSGTSMQPCAPSAAP